MNMKTTIAFLASAFLASCAANATPSSASNAKGVKPYPKKICLVTDNKLGSMGSPITKVYADQEVKFCCKPCVAKFEKNPQKYLAKIQ